MSFLSSLIKKMIQKKIKKPSGSIRSTPKDGDPMGTDFNLRVPPIRDVESAQRGAKQGKNFREKGTFFDAEGKRRKSTRSKTDRRKPSNSKILSETVKDTAKIVVPAGAAGVMAKQHVDRKRKAEKAKKANRKTKLTKDSVPLTEREIEKRFHGKN